MLYEVITQHFGLARVGALVDVKARRALDLARPEVALPAPHAHEAQAVELDLAVVPALDVPEQHRVAVAVVRRLGEGAGAGHCAAAVVEPVSRITSDNVCYTK